MSASKEQVKNEWTQNAAAWRKWQQPLDAMTAGVTALLIDAAAPAPGQRVLDLASGTGDPALSLARVVGPTGAVVATDVVPEMLDAARVAASRAGLKNVTFEVVDMDALDHDDESFDRVTCRFGVTFCPAADEALRQARRVLKTGGRATYVVWGTPAQPYFSTWMAPFRRRVDLPSPPPDAPTGFRFAAPGSLAQRMRAAGFVEVAERTVTVPWVWPGPADEMWAMQQEIVPQLLQRFRDALSSADYAAAQAEARDALRAAERDGGTAFEATVHVVTGTR